MAIVQYDLIRTIMAENLLQPIQEAKAERLAGIQSMFEDMGKFRMQWQEYRREREKSVWGGERVKSTPATPQKAKASQTLSNYYQNAWHYTQVLIDSKSLS